MTTHYQIHPGNTYVVQSTFSSNPKPLNVTWKFGDPEVSLIIPESRGRYFTFLHDLDSNKYNARLLIFNITQDDSKTNYSLLVHNKLGKTTYQISLDEPEPATDPGPDSGSSPWYPVAVCALVILAAVICICICICIEMAKILRKDKISSCSAKISAYLRGNKTEEVRQEEGTPLQ